MTKERATVVVLALEQHKNDVWITRLVETFPENVEVSVITLESLLENLNPATPSFPFAASLLVNRVSDAALPHLQKACMGILQLAVSVYDIPVWNGPASYSLCCNKWCHHVLFARAGLNSPSTRALLNATKESLKQAVCQVKGEEESESSSVLLKPNAGGFGAGVKRIDSSNVSLQQQSLVDETVSNYADKVTLVQDYVNANIIYRVWFLCGKVQCGIERINEQGDYEFTSACMGNTCTRQLATKAITIRAYSVPHDVQEELEERLLPLLPDGHSGSVEFLYNEKGNRLYFDLNLLSTLPLVEQVQDEASVWTSDYDPWKEMANTMVNMIPCRKILYRY